MEKLVAPPEETNAVPRFANLKEQSSDKFYHRLALTEIVIRSTFLLHVSGDDDDVSVIPLNRYIRPIWCPVCTITR
jgi:hypothetical protein